MVFPLVLTQAMGSPSLEENSQENSTSTDLSEIYFPSKIGVVTDSYQSTKNQTTIFYIKDIHCNLEGQLNISKMIEELSKKQRIQLVLVEGAQGKVQTDLLGCFPDSKIRKKVSRKFLAKGFISGCEYLAISKFNKIPIHIYGIEDEQLYLKNYYFFKEVYEKASDTNQFMNVSKIFIQRLKRKVFNKKLLKVDHDWKEYQEGKLALVKFVKTLSREEWNNRASPNLVKLLKILSVINQKNPSLLEKEHRSFIQRLSQILSADQTQVLIKLILKKRLSKISDEEYFSRLKNILPSNHITRLRNQFSVLFGVFDLHRFLKEKSEKLALELEDAVDLLFERLAKTEEEKNLLNLSLKLETLEKALTLTLSRKEFEKEGQNFDLDQFIQHLESLYKKQSDNFSVNKIDFLWMKKMKGLVESGKSFYRLALKREDQMVQNALQKIKEEGVQKAILIAGGFHSQGLMEKLKKRGISCIAIMPILKKRDEGHLYLERMLSQNINLKFIQNFSISSLSVLDLLSDTASNDDDRTEFLRSFFHYMVTFYGADSLDDEETVIHRWRQQVIALHSELLLDFNQVVESLLFLAKTIALGQREIVHVLKDSLGNQKKMLQMKVILSFLYREQLSVYDEIKLKIDHPSLIAYMTQLEESHYITNRFGVWEVSDDTRNDRDSTDVSATADLLGEDNILAESDSGMGVAYRINEGRAISERERLEEVFSILSNFCKAKPRIPWIQIQTDHRGKYLYFCGSRILSITPKTFLRDAAVSFFIRDADHVEIRKGGVSYILGTTGTMDILEDDISTVSHAKTLLRRQVQRLRLIHEDKIQIRNYWEAFCRYFQDKASEGSPYRHAIVAFFIDEILKNLSRQAPPEILGYALVVLDQLREKILELVTEKEEEGNFENQASFRYVIRFCGYSLLGYTQYRFFIPMESLDQTIAPITQVTATLLESLLNEPQIARTSSVAEMAVAELGRGRANFFQSAQRGLMERRSSSILEQAA